MHMCACICVCEKNVQLCLLMRLSTLKAWGTRKMLRVLFHHCFVCFPLRLLPDCRAPCLFSSRNHQSKRYSSPFPVLWAATDIFKDGWLVIWVQWFTFPVLMIVEQALLSTSPLSIPFYYIFITSQMMRDHGIL